MCGEGLVSSVCGVLCLREGVVSRVWGRLCVYVREGVFWVWGAYV